MSPTIRLATEHDADQIRAIYAPFCDDSSPTSFETQAPDGDEMRRRIAKTLARHPWLVCDRGGEVLGFVYAGTHRERAAYAWSADVSVYVRDGLRRSGVGRALYTSLFQALRLQGYYNAFAGITLPNPGSVGLHEALGFEPVGTYRDVGYKGGRWHDVAWWRLPLLDPTPAPSPPIALPAARLLDGWEPALASGTPWLRV